MTTNLSNELLFEMAGKEKVFEDMLNTCEARPYHREDNVLMHTSMVCDWYVMNYRRTKSLEECGASHESLDGDYFLGLFACLLHDVAKPECQTQKENDKRGVYYGYDKHDVIGADKAEEILARYDVSEFEIYRIKWMIQHHSTFWSTKNKVLRFDMASFMTKHDCYLPFKYFMLADTNGRVCDEGLKRIDLDEQFFKDFELEFGIKTI